MRNERLVLPKVQGIRERRKGETNDGMVGIAYRKPIPSLRKCVEFREEKYGIDNSAKIRKCSFQCIF